MIFSIFIRKNQIHIIDSLLIANKFEFSNFISKLLEIIKYLQKHLQNFKQQRKKKATKVAKILVTYGLDKGKIF